MKKKIIKSILTFLFLIVIGLSYNVVSYASNQEYAKVATQQLNDDNSYYTLKTQKSTSTLIDVVFCLATLGTLSIFYLIWKPNKLKDTTDTQETV